MKEIYLLIKMLLYGLLLTLKTIEVVLQKNICSMTSEFSREVGITPKCVKRNLIWMLRTCDSYLFELVNEGGFKLYVSQDGTRIVWVKNAYISFIHSFRNTQAETAQIEALKLILKW